MSTCVDRHCRMTAAKARDRWAVLAEPPSIHDKNTLAPRPAVKSDKGLLGLVE